MALARAAGLCRLALRTQWAAVRLLGLTAAGGEPPSDEHKRRRIDLEPLQRERALRPPTARPEPPHGSLNVIFGSLEQRKLGKAIRDSVSVEKVLDLVTGPRSAFLNGVGISTALLIIARQRGKQAPSKWLKDDVRFRQLMRSALSVMKRGRSEPGVMDAQGLSNMLYACGQLGITPPLSWLEVYWDISSLRIAELCTQGFSNTLYACCQLGVTPPADWLERFWHASVLKLPEFDPQALSNTLYACGQLGIIPPDYWLERFWHASASKLPEFNPQDCSNTLYACGQLGIKPPADWLERFWHASALKLGEFIPQALSNTLYACGQLGITTRDYWLERFWRASALKLGDFIPQHYSNTLYACVQLRVTPPADWLQSFFHFSAAKLGDFNPQDSSNVILACGLLDTRPPAVWLQSFSESFERMLPDSNQQGLANTALALAMLALWELPLWRGLWERLCASLPRGITGWNAEDLLNARQLYQAYQAAAAEQPGLLPAPSPELLAGARKCWVDGLETDNVKTSRLHADVSACLTSMGVMHANERWCECAERSIDIAIEGSEPVAIEVDGPYHFLHDGRQDGSTRLRNRMLAAHGWRVVVVDYRAWRILQTEAQRQEYLRGLLA